MQNNIPSRDQIQDKIEQIKSHPGFSTIKADIYQGVSDWLDTLNMPQTITRFGEQISPKEEILSDLDSYENY